MASVEFDYEISEEHLRAYRALPDEAKLRWLDNIVRFTLLFRAAPIDTPVNAQPGNQD